MFYHAGEPRAEGDGPRVIFFPMGTKMTDWTPPEVNHLPQNLPLNLRAMAALRQDFSMITELRER